MRFFALAFAALLVLGGCGSGTSDPATSDDAEQRFAKEGDFAGSHILVAYQGATQAGPDIIRTKEEARAKAVDLIAQIKKDPAQFEELAKEESDGPSGPRGGSLGSWQKGQMVPEFDAAIETMTVGAVTEEPVETPFGYHVIRRDALEVPYYGGDAFFIAFAGMPQLPAEITRTQAEAEALANEIAPRVTADTFDELANEYNDLGDGPLFLGAFAATDPVPEELMETMKGLGFGEVGGPVSYPFGYAFIRRQRLEQRSGAHILVAYQGSERAAPTVTRSKEEAHDKAEALIAQLKADPSQFAALAAAESDGPSASNGGDLGTWFKGEMVPAFDAALDHLDVDDIADEPVETPFGYHVIVRRPVVE